MPKIEGCEFLQMKNDTKNSTFFLEQTLSWLEIEPAFSWTSYPIKTHLNKSIFIFREMVGVWSSIIQKAVQEILPCRRSISPQGLSVSYVILKPMWDIARGMIKWSIGPLADWILCILAPTLIILLNMHSSIMLRPRTTVHTWYMMVNSTLNAFLKLCLQPLIQIRPGVVVAHWDF